jgi:hypothetical protein
MRKARFTRLTTIAVLAASVTLLAGVAWASIPDSGGVIHACYARKDGGLRLIDTATSACKSTETAIAWFQKQPVIPPQRWARVAFDGTIEASSHVASVQHIGTGQYEVHFDTGVGGCAFVATPAKVPADVGALVEEPPADDTVLVVTTTEAGAIDMGFSLVVAC